MMNRSFFAVAAIIVCITACKPEPAPNPQGAITCDTELPVTMANLTGTWKWSYSQGGFAPTGDPIYRPDDDRLTLNADSTYIWKTNGSITSQGDFEIVTDTSIYNDMVIMIRYDGNEYSSYLPRVCSETMILTGNFADAADDYFQRVP